MNSIEEIKQEILKLHNDPDFLLEDALNDLIYEAKDHKYPRAYACKSCKKNARYGVLEERLICVDCGREVHPDDLDINELNNYEVL